MRTTLTLNQIVEQWIAGCDRLPATKCDYKRKIHLWFKWLASQGIDPREPSREHIVRFKQSLQREGKSPYTYFTYVAVIKIFYRFCAAMRYYDDIGKGLQSSIRQHEHSKHPLSVEEAQRLLNSIETKTIVGKRDKLIIALMLLNGLRSCEVSRINIEDVERKGALYEELLRDHPTVVEIRRSGLLLAVELGSEERLFKVMELFKDEGIMSDWFLYCATAFRISPPLVISDEEIRESVEIIRRVLDKL